MALINPIRENTSRMERALKGELEAEKARSNWADLFKIWSLPTRIAQTDLELAHIMLRSAPARSKWFTVLS